MNYDAATEDEPAGEVLLRGPQLFSGYYKQVGTVLRSEVTRIAVPFCLVTPCNGVCWLHWGRGCYRGQERPSASARVPASRLLHPGHAHAALSFAVLHLC